MLVKTSKIMYFELMKHKVTLLGVSIFSILLTNAAVIGTFKKCYGIAGHSISTATILTASLILFHKSKQYIISLICLFLLFSIPAYYLSSALTYAGRDDSVHNRIVIDGNLSAFLLTSILLLIILFTSTLKTKVLKITSIVMSCALWILVFCQFIAVVFYRLNYGQGPTGPVIFAIIQTNYDEAYEYIVSQGNIVVVCSVLVIFLFPALAYLIYKVHTALLNQIRLLQGDDTIIVFRFKLILLCLFAIIFLFNLNLSNAYNSYRSAIITFYQQKDFRESINERSEMLSSLNLKNTDSNEGLYVVVIGESLTRDHMSAYGYSRLTTPWLDSMIGNPNFHLFENPYSAHVISAFALSMVLTSMSQYDMEQRQMSECPSIVEIAKSAGFEVTWLSNHTYYGLTSKPHSVIASASDKKVWINQYNNDISYKTEYYDEELLEELKKYIRTTESNCKRLIFIHLFGSHAEYSQRSPEPFKLWEEHSESDSYDNSVLYNDWVVSQIYKLAYEQPDLKAIIYFSDHGEQMGVGHTPDAFTYSMARIPFWISLTDSYILRHPNVSSAIKANIKKPFSNDTVFDIICGLTGITSHPFYSAEHDITSASFNMAPDKVTVLNTHKVIDDKEYRQ